MTSPVEPAPELPRPSRASRRVDVLLIVFTLAFAFLAASFAATHSDLWLHLASGRLIASGQYHFGVDPFSFETDGIYWTNHAWLFDLFAYQVYQSAGGAAVVALKALGVTATVGILLRLSLRTGAPIWLAAGCTMLGILAMSPRLLVQPQCLSLFLLALCLWLLERGYYRGVPLLIAVWVNVDAWFLFGPALVALFVLGRRGETRRPLWLLPASLFAGLLNPHHFHAFTLPPELSPSVWSSGIADDPHFVDTFSHPWRAASFGRTGGYSLAAWAFPVLLVGGMVSFAVNRRAIRTWRGPVWLLFAIVAACLSRLVPFFAVVGAPILARNVGEVLATGRSLRAGRIVVFVAALALLILSWPGWLQGFYSRDRALAWTVMPDPSLVHAAEQIRDWRQSGKLAADIRVFTTHPDAAHHLMWFAPGEKTALDSRLQLFTRAAADRWEADLTLVADPDRQMLGAALRELAEHPEQRSLVQVSGAAIFMQGRSGSLPRFNADRLAFGGGVSAPPFEGPPSWPEPPSWWNLAGHRQTDRSWETDAAPVYLRLFELQRTVERSPALPLLATRAARIGLAANPRSDAAWLALAQAYIHLGRSWEGSEGRSVTLIRFLRHVQVAAALVQATTFNPDAMLAHELLASAFGERGFVDLQLHHRREQFRLLRRQSADSPGQSELRARLNENIEQLERNVQDSENRFLVHTSALSGNPHERARIARNLGLANKAIDTLVQSHPDLYGPKGLSLLIDLFLETGRIEEARILLDRVELRNNPDALETYVLPGGVKDGVPWSYTISAYHWFDFCRCAAAGQYDRALLALADLRERLQKEEHSEAAILRPYLVYRLVTEYGSSLNPIHGMDAALKRELAGERWKQAFFMRVERGDAHLLGALTRIEFDAAPAVLLDVEQALRFYADVERSVPILPGRALAIRYRDTILKYEK